MKKGTENVPEGDEAAVTDQEPGVEVHAVAAVQSSKDGASSEVNRSKEVPKKTQGKNSSDNGDAASKVKKAKQPAPGAQDTEKGQGFKSFFDVFKSSSGTGTPADAKKAKDGHTEKPAHKQGRDDNEGNHDLRKSCLNLTSFLTGRAESLHTPEPKKELTSSETSDDKAIDNTTQQTSQAQPRAGKDMIPPRTSKGTSDTKEARIASAGKGSKTSSERDPAPIVADSDFSIAEEQPEAAIDKKPIKDVKTERKGRKSSKSTRSKTGERSDSEVQSVNVSTEEKAKVKKKPAEREGVTNAPRANNDPPKKLNDKAGVKIDESRKDIDVLEGQVETGEST